ncbi:MAG TPA: cobalamin-independent methionine synthase II family protein [Ktedonobacteraceae bacterium]|nr:cobalamin-independent methionine synthase II family protein [Ktedonobacteraceae bacterium]
MRRSTTRILTTHTGSLPRPDNLMRMMIAREQGQAVSAGELADSVQNAVADTVKHQVAIGIDIISDGEMSKIGFANYVKDRLTGFGGQSIPFAAQDLLDFPDLKQHQLRRNEDGGGRNFIPACTGPISLSDKDAVHRDIANLKAALQEAQPEGVFMPAASPGAIAQVMQNNYYPTQEAYLYALADAMRYEYQAIVAAGFSLQLDCPDLAMQRHVRFASASIEEFRTHLLQSVEVLNYALNDISPEQVRVHVCWGNYHGPHHRDVPLKEIIDLLLKIRVNALSIEAANPRHEHEWNVFEQVRLPEGKILIPGMIDSCTNYIEHPEVVAQRIVRFARVVGRENVIAGTDCGFDTFAGAGAVAPGIAWAKLQSLAEGARLASQALW